MTFTDRTFWIYPWDLAGEEASARLERIHDLGATGISIPYSYHSVRALAPRHGGKKVFQAQAALYFRPEPGEFPEVSLQPGCSPMATGQGPVAGLAEAARASGLRLRAWTVVFHNTPLASGRPDCAIVNCFGDVFAHALCPAAPPARAYALSLARSVAARGVDAIELEACGYFGYTHQAHHDKCGIPLDEFHHFLFSCCFCAHCSGWFTQAGLDTASIRSSFRNRLNTLFNGDAIPGEAADSAEQLAGLIGEADARTLIRVRGDRVLGLLREIRETIPSRIEVTVTSGLSPFECGALFGAEPGETLRFSERLLLVVFEEREDRFRRRFQAALEKVADASRWIAGIRAFPPDVSGEGQLRARLEFLAGQGFQSLHIYHYGLAAGAQLTAVARSLGSAQRVRRALRVETQ